LRERRSRESSLLVMNREVEADLGTEIVDAAPQRTEDSPKLVEMSPAIAVSTLPSSPDRPERAILGRHSRDMAPSGI
jgi:hypothetical protein